jgi:hypothetical protein
MLSPSRRPAGPDAASLPRSTPSAAKLNGAGGVHNPLQILLARLPRMQQHAIRLLALERAEILSRMLAHAERAQAGWADSAASASGFPNSSLSAVVLSTSSSHSVAGSVAAARAAGASTLHRDPDTLLTLQTALRDNAKEIKYRVGPDVAREVLAALRHPSVQEALAQQLGTEEEAADHEVADAAAERGQRDPARAAQRVWRRRLAKLSHPVKLTSQYAYATHDSPDVRGNKTLTNALNKHNFEDLLSNFQRQQLTHGRGRRGSTAVAGAWEGLFAPQQQPQPQQGRMAVTAGDIYGVGGATVRSTAAVSSSAAAVASASAILERERLRSQGVVPPEEEVEDDYDHHDDEYGYGAEDGEGEGEHDGGSYASSAARYSLQDAPSSGHGASSYAALHAASRPLSPPSPRSPAAAAQISAVEELLGLMSMGDAERAEVVALKRRVHELAKSPPPPSGPPPGYTQRAEREGAATAGVASALAAVTVYGGREEGEEWDGDGGEQQVWEGQGQTEEEDAAAAEEEDYYLRQAEAEAAEAAARAAHEAAVRGAGPGRFSVPAALHNRHPAPAPAPDADFDAMIAAQLAVLAKAAGAARPLQR